MVCVLLLAMLVICLCWCVVITDILFVDALMGWLGLGFYCLVLICDVAFV